MEFEFTKCDRHQKKILQYLCIDLNCGNDNRILCQKCLKEQGNNNHIKCQENNKIMKIKKFLNNMNKSLKPSIDLLNEKENFLKLFKRIDLFCAEMRQKIRSSTLGHFILKQKIEALDNYPSAQNLQNVLQDENFSQNLIQDQFNNDHNFSLTDNLKNIEQQIQEIEKKIDDEIKLIEQQPNLKQESNKYVQQKRNYQMAHVENKSEAKNIKLNNKNTQVFQNQLGDGHIQDVVPCQQLYLPSQSLQKYIQEEPLQPESRILNVGKSIPIKEQGISNISGQGAQNSSIISNVSSKANKKDLVDREEFAITDQTINSIIVMNENFLILMTDKQLFRAKLNRVQQKWEHETIPLHKSDQKILNQTLYEKKELIFQTQDLNIHHMNLDTERIIKSEVRASPNLYSYSRKYQSLYLLSPNKQTIQKYTLKSEKFEFEKEIHLQNSVDLIYLEHHNLGFLTITKDGNYQEYDPNLQSIQKYSLQYKELTDIQSEHKYNCYVENNKLYLELKQIKKRIPFELPESIRQFSVHDHLYGKVILISCILNNGIFYFIKLDEYGNILFQGPKLRQCTYQSSAFHQSSNKQPTLYLANKGNIIFYRVRIDNQNS